MTKQELIATVEREIRYRERAYPRWVAAGKMSEALAREQLFAMRAVRDAIDRHVPEEPPRQRALF
jgi:hypothetical protein